MTDTLELSRQLNACIKDSDVYKNYQYCKDKLRQKPEKLQQLMEFDSIVHDTIVNDFIRAEQKLVRMMKLVYEQIADDLDFDIIDEDAR